MANVLDLRRRIRSVKNMRQITKAMKMVSAAKLRRAQERAMAARPYAPHDHQRAGIADPPRRHLRSGDRQPAPPPSLPTREEKRVLLVVVSGDKGFAGAFNSNILKAAFQFINGNPGREIDIEADRPQGTRPDAPPLCRRGVQRADQRRRPQALEVSRRSQRSHRSHRRSSRHARQARSRARV